MHKIHKLICISGFLIIFFIPYATSRIMSSHFKPDIKSKQDEVTGSGIVFFNTQKLDDLKDFYIHRVGCELWLDQGSCAILKYGNMLVGFCKGRERDKGGLITFFFKSREDVDRMYKKFAKIAESPPKENKKYHIYHFYARDPEGRSLEFQHFLHPIDWDFYINNN